jgi:hypothetical protein
MPKKTEIANMCRTIGIDDDRGGDPGEPEHDRLPGDDRDEGAELFEDHPAPRDRVRQQEPDRPVTLLPCHRRRADRQRERAEGEGAVRGVHRAVGEPGGVGILVDADQ